MHWRQPPRGPAESPPITPSRFLRKTGCKPDPRDYNRPSVGMVGARTRAQIHPGRAYSSVVERFLDMEEVRSSILRTPTIFYISRQFASLMSPTGRTDRAATSRSLDFEFELVFSTSTSFSLTNNRFAIASAGAS